MIEVLLLNNVPAPYFNPLFDALGREEGIRLTVCYVSDWNRDVAWRETELESRASHRTVVLDRLNPRVARVLGSQVAAAFALIVMLVRRRPDYLVCYGYTLVPQMSALAWSLLTGMRYAIAGDANAFIDNPTGIKRLIKGAWLRLVTAQAAALIVIGAANRRFWESYGARPGQLFDAPFAVDNDYFERAAAEAKDSVEALRARFGFSGKTVFLYAGRLVARKNVDLIISAARRLNDDGIAVLIAGDGEERERLESLAGDAQNIVFAGRIEPSELPVYYAVSDVLVLPAAQEPWGLVVNEAMASGLAVIAHRHCGSAVDLVDDSNGYRMNEFSVEELAAAMARIAGDRSGLEKMKRVSRERIDRWTTAAAAEGLARAIRTTAVGKEIGR